MSVDVFSLKSIEWHVCPNPGNYNNQPCLFREMRLFILEALISLESESEVAQSCPTLCDPVACTRLLHPCDFLGKSTTIDKLLAFRRATRTPVQFLWSYSSWAIDLVYMLLPMFYSVL